jgi:hypothetical protein
MTPNLVIPAEGTADLSIPSDSTFSRRTSPTTLSLDSQNAFGCAVGYAESHPRLDDLWAR